jgi:DNA-directed RNA polymerase subunit D
MKIEFLEENELKARFILSNASIAFANSFRRAMKSLIPTMAVDWVDFYLNTSFLYDEVLAHRIGLIPIKTDLDRFNMPDKCVCGNEGCPSCQVSFRLNVEGPKIVYSGDFISDDPSTRPVFDNIPVVELYKGQQLMIEAVARLGIGKEHAKFQPVSVCVYKIIPKIEIAENCTNCGECIKVCPRDILKDEEGITVGDVSACSMCMECVNVCDENAISVEETDNFLFTVEGIGSLPVRTVMKKALEILNERAKEMNKILESLDV